MEPLVMVGGTNLDEYLSTQNPPWATRLKLGAQIADGLAHLHSVNLTHRYLRAVNVLVSENGTPVITGFGYSILSCYSKERYYAAKPNNLFIRWIAPEQFESMEETQMADVWALGMVILEMFTGSVPYIGLSDAEAFENISKSVLPERPEEHVPTGDTQADILWLLLEQCWAPDPINRPTAAGVHDKLEEMHLIYAPRNQDGPKGSSGDSH